MRCTLWRLFGFICLSTFAACGGGGGGSNGASGGGGGGGGGGGVPNDPETSSAASAVLLNSSAPDSALQNLAGQMRTLYEQQGDAGQAASTVESSYLAAIQSSDDISRLFEAMGSGGALHTVPPPSGASVQAFAIDTSDVCHAQDQQDVILYFVNGVFNTQQDALNSRQVLASWWRERTHAYPDWKIRLYYNRSGIQSSNADDLCQSMIGNGVFELLPIAANWTAALQRACNSVVGGTLDLAQLGAQWFAQWVNFNPGSLDAGVRAFRNQILQDILSGHGVVIVAHSQGNFYAQEAIDGLPPVVACGDVRKAIGVVALASPATYPNRTDYGYFDYLTLEGDFPGLLTPNGSNDVSNSAVLRATVHNLVHSYLGDVVSRTRILDMVAGAVETLRLELASPSMNRPQTGEGLFQVTVYPPFFSGSAHLTIREPNGTYVYANRPTGTSGMLDAVSDGVCVGENYFVCSAADMQVGTWELYVDQGTVLNDVPIDVFIRAGTRTWHETFTFPVIPGCDFPNALPYVTYGADGSFRIGPGGPTVGGECGGTFAILKHNDKPAAK